MKITFMHRCNAVLVGSFMIAVGINVFLIPRQILDGGLIGLGLLMQYFLGWLPGQSIFLFSIPIFVFVFFYKRNLFYYSILGLVVSTFFIDLLSPFRHMISISTPIHAMFGGALIGSGIGIMLSYGVNTGGTDLIAQLLYYRYKIHPAIVIFIIDFVILMFGIQIIGLERILYSMITIVFGAFFTHYFSIRRFLG